LPRRTRSALAGAEYARHTRHLGVGIDANPANAYTKDVFNVLPVRNYFLTLSAEF